MKRKFASLVLALAMCLGLAVPAFAESAPISTEEALKNLKVEILDENVAMKDLKVDKPWTLGNWDIVDGEDVQIPETKDGYVAIKKDTQFKVTHNGTADDGTTIMIYITVYENDGSGVYDWTDWPHSLYLTKTGGFIDDILDPELEGGGLVELKAGESVTFTLPFQWYGDAIIEVRPTILYPQYDHSYYWYAYFKADEAAYNAAAAKGDSQPSTPSQPAAPSQPSAPGQTTGVYPIPDSKGMAEFSAPPLRTYTDTIADIDAYQDDMDDIPEKEITVYEVADGTKLILSGAAKQKGYTVSRLNGEEPSGDELVLHPAGPAYEWYLMTAEGETYEEVEASSIMLYIRPIKQNAVSFQDVKASDYYHDAIQWAVKYGVTSGTSATSFSPNDTCTVGQILTFLWRADGMEEFWEYGDKKFGNIARNDYYYHAALWALNSYEMVSGANFAADTPCTRSMVATYLWKLAYSPTPASTSCFTDVPASAEYAQAVSWMVEQGITSGTTATTFSPDNICTRGQIATFIYRYYENLDLD